MRRVCPAVMLLRHLSTPTASRPGPGRSAGTATGSGWLLPWTHPSSRVGRLCKGRPITGKAFMNRFNANFFIVIATVIPVLYLALTLQGPTYERMMARWRSAVREGHRDRSFRSEARTVTAAFLAIVGTAVILYSVLAEYLSLRALYSQTASVATQGTGMTTEPQRIAGPRGWRPKELGITGQWSG